jgi:hypothetical protein
MVNEISRSARESFWKSVENDISNEITERVGEDGRVGIEIIERKRVWVFLL